ncbi:hypothetical protein E2O03_013495 [Candidatus Magnetomonas plexicatena]|nr:hypothetical protein E2O03_013495 [Nitrospirales bacterium LBB_01]
MSKQEPTQLKGFDFESFQQEAIKQLKSGKPLSGKEGVVTQLIKRIIEAALEGELDNHLSEERESGGKNRKNGSISKTVKTDQIAFELETPRDRNSSFEPEIVKKRQTYLGYERTK